MEFCGGHTHAISRYGLKDLLPATCDMIHGPGCPVCVLPIGRIDNAIALAARPGLILCTYADTMRVPASKGLSLLKAKARGADIRMVYSAPTRCDRAAESGARRRVLRHRLRDHDAADRRRDPPGTGACARQLQRVLQPRADPVGDRQHPRVARGARARHRAARRLHRTRARFHGDRQPALRVLRRGIPAARRHRRLRAARRDAGDPDAGAPVERGPRRGRERVHARRDARRQRQGEGAGRRRLRAAPHVRMAGPGRSALQRAAHQGDATPRSTPRRATGSSTTRCPTTRRANAAPSCAA